MFAGTGFTHENHLAALLSFTNAEVIAVYTQPDRPAGRGKEKLTASPVNIAHLKTIFRFTNQKNFKSDEAKQELAI